MDNENKKINIPEGFSSIEDALMPASFSEKRDIAEEQLFLTPWQMIMRRFLRNKLAIVGVILLVAMAVFCFLVPIVYPYSETEIFYVHKVTGEEVRTTDTAMISDSILGSLQKPSLGSHVLGTNKLGQDVLARIMFGGRISLRVGFLVVAIELILGIILGGIAGYYGKILDAIIMRVVDIISSIPFIPLMLIISALLISLNISPVNKIYYTMFIMGFLYWPHVARMVRGNILSLREMEFMQAATATGITVPHKIFRHLIPNTLSNLIVIATLDLGGIILTESTMSFLGVGVGAPYASWGNMVSEVADFIVMVNHPNIWVAPGMCILLTVLAFNFVGDGLRDATDPKMKR